MLNKLNVYKFSDMDSLHTRIIKRSLIQGVLTNNPGKVKGNKKYNLSIYWRYIHFFSGILFSLILIIIYFEATSVAPLVETYSESVVPTLPTETNPLEVKGSETSLRHVYLKSESIPTDVKTSALVPFLGVIGFAVIGFVGGMYLYDFICPVSLIDFTGQTIEIGPVGTPTYTPSLITGKAVTFSLPPLSPEVKVDGVFPSEVPSLIDQYFVPSNEK